MNNEAGNLHRNIGHNQYSMHTDNWANRFYLVERFAQKPQLNAALDLAANAGGSYDQTTLQSIIDGLVAGFAVNPNFELVNTTGAANGDVTFANGGGIILASSAASAREGILQAHTNTLQTAWLAAKWNTEDEISFDAVIKTGAAITTHAFMAGFKLTNTFVTTTDANQTFFRYENAVNSGKIQCIDSNNDTDNAMDSGVTVVLGTDYWLRLVVDGNRVPRYYINGALVATGNALKATTDLKVFIGVKGNAQTMKIRGIACGKSYND